MSSSGGGGGSAQVTLGPGGRKKVQEFTFKLAEQMMRQLNDVDSFQALLYGTSRPQVDRLGPQVSEADRLASGGDALFGDIETFQRDYIRRQAEFEASGGAANDTQKELIARQTESALAAGQSDIRQALTEGLGLIRSELAPGLGLRPGDSPLIDRGGLLAREALRQEGQLSLGLRSEQARKELEFPLAARQVSNQGAALQAGIKEFQAALRDNAFKNRLALTSGGASLGLGAHSAGLNSFNTMSNVLRKSSQAATNATTADYLNATGNFLSGAGSLYGAR